MRNKLLLLIIPCFCLVLKVSGQQTFTVKGVISRNISVERIAQVLVTNQRSHDIMMSDELGWFSIKAAVGDTLVFKKINYEDLKIAILAQVDIPVYMTPVIQLEQVTIKGQTKKQEINDIMSDYRRNGTFYNGKPPVTSFITNPLTGIYELFGKTPNQAKRFAKFSKGELEFAEVKRRYNLPMVMRVTKASDTVAQKFMQFYTPSYEDLKGWNDYELIKQIHKQYEFYSNSDDKVRLQQLNQPTFIKPADQPEK